MVMTTFSNSTWSHKMVEYSTMYDHVEVQKGQAISDLSWVDIDIDHPTTCLLPLGHLTFLTKNWILSQLNSGLYWVFLNLCLYWVFDRNTQPFLVDYQVNHNLRLNQYSQVEYSTWSMVAANPGLYQHTQDLVPIIFQPALIGYLPEIRHLCPVESYW